MKKWISLLLALAMMMTAVFAFAETAEPDPQAADQPAAPQTVDVRISVDPEIAKTVMAAFGVDESQIGLAEKVLTALSSLGVKAVSADGGLQIDLDVQGTTVLSLGGAATEEGLIAGSSLFPNYLISGSAEALAGMMQQMMPASESAGESADESAGESASGLGINPEAFSGYFTAFVQTCMAAVVPGEAETGSFEFEGFTFDTHTPMTVDVPAMIAAWKKMVTEMIQDEAVTGMLQSIPGFDPSQILQAAGDVPAEYIPDVTVDVYINSDGSDPFYTVSEATFKGAEAPAHRYTMLSKGEGNGTVTYEAAEIGLNMSMNYAPDGFRMDWTVGEMWFALEMTGAENAHSFSFYALEKEKPLLTVAVTVSEEGERTLSLDPEGKTVLNIADLMGEKASEASAGLLQDFMTNGMQKLMAVPEIAGLMTMLTPSAEQEQQPEESEAKPEADPSAWKTLADVLSLETEGMEQTYSGDGYDVMFSYGGRFWLVTADFSEELFDQMMKLDVFADDWKEQRLAILGPCEITEIVDLGTLALPQEELDSWIGKTGQDLLDAGWEYNGTLYLDHRICVNMVNGKFQYAVSFSEELEQPEVFGDAPDYAGATISGIEFNGASYHFSEEE